MPRRPALLELCCERQALLPPTRPGARSSILAFARRGEEEPGLGRVPALRTLGDGVQKAVRKVAVRGERRGDEIESGEVDEAREVAGVINEPLEESCNRLIRGGEHIVVEAELA